MVDTGILDDCRRASPVNGVPPALQARLTCTRELAHHYLRISMSVAESCTLGGWSASERIATIEKEGNRYEQARVKKTIPGLPATTAKLRGWFEVTAEVHKHHDTWNHVSNGQAFSISSFWRPPEEKSKVTSMTSWRLPGWGRLG